MSRPNQDMDKRVMQRIKKARERNEPVANNFIRWIKDAAVSKNRLAEVYIGQVKAAYDADFKSMLSCGLTSMRYEVDTLPPVHTWEEFIKLTYEPSTLIRCLSDVYSWRLQERM